MSQNNLIGIFGGTFDPIHFGHLRIALEILEHCAFQELRFIPCYVPVHKEKVYTSAEHRLAMLKLAINNQPNFVIDEQELKRDTASYTVLTLETLKKEFPKKTLCLIMGFDALANLDTWFRWEEILNLCNIISVQRPISTILISRNIKRLLQQHKTDHLSELQNNAFGKIYSPPTSLLNISATEIRNIIFKKRNPRYLLPENVIDYINTNDIYRNL